MNKNLDQKTLVNKYHNAINQLTEKELSKGSGKVIPIEKIKAMRFSLMMQLSKLDCIYNFACNDSKDDRMIHINSSLAEFNDNLTYFLRGCEKEDYGKYFVERPKK